jgi:hypothetical protein
VSQVFRLSIGQAVNSAAIINIPLMVLRFPVLRITMLAAAIITFTMTE